MPKEEIGLEAKVKLSVQLLVRSFVDNHKTWKSEDKTVLTAAVWDAIGTEAKTKSEDAWNKMLSSGIYEEPPREVPTDMMVGVTPHFEVHGKVTEPIKRFNEGKLAEILKTSKFKIPEHITKAFVQEAKVGTKGNLYLSIIPKGA